jgi:hypothetical protein
MRFLIVAIMAVVLLRDQIIHSAYSQATNCDNPIPKLNIIKPTSEIPSDYAQFVGQWDGKWDGQLCSSLIIEKVDTKGAATIVYSLSRFGNFKAQWRRSTAEISGRILRFGGRSKFKFVVRNGMLLGQRDSQRGSQSIRMARAK